MRWKNPRVVAALSTPPEARIDGVQHCATGQITHHYRGRGNTDEFGVVGPGGMTGPNIIQTGLSTLLAFRVGRPRFEGTSTITDTLLGPILAMLAGPDGISNVSTSDVSAYVDWATGVDPTALRRNDALAYWINTYNALGLQLAIESRDRRLDSVLNVKSGFTRPVVNICGERLSLIDIEHGKIRRFRDPRVHSALVCGSVSCPTLRSEPFTGDGLDEQLDDQMRSFQKRGGFVIDRDGGTVSLSRVFLWFGSDFVRPHRMPTVFPATRKAVAVAVAQWIEPRDQLWLNQNQPRIEFQAYDWGLGCVVA